MGMKEPQAEAAAGAIHRSIRDATAYLATKVGISGGLVIFSSHGWAGGVQ